MASIGELTATVRADISGYVAPMQKVAASTQSVAQQLAAAEGRVTQLAAAWSALQKKPMGAEFERATAEVARLRAQLAATTPAVERLATRQAQAVPLFAQTATTTREAAQGLATMRGSVASLASSMAGIPGPLGSIASKFLMFGVGGTVTVAVLAGVAAIAAIFRTANEEASKQADTIQSLSDAYEELSGSAHRARLAMAQQAVQAANANTRLGITTTRNARGIPIPGIGQVRDMEAVARANRALLEAQRALTEFEENRARPAVEASTKAEKERLAGLRELGRSLSGITNLLGVDLFRPAVESAAKWVTMQRQLKEEIRATTRAQEELNRAVAAKGILGVKGDQSVKEAITGSQSESVEAMRGAANGLAQAFMSAFSDNEKSLMERIASVLKNAILNAIEKVLAQKLFEAFLGAATGGAGKGVADIGGGIIKSFLGTPSIPTPAMAGSGNTIVVPLDGLPAPLGPIEMARDAMHTALWIETARQAQMNGVNLSPRYR